MRSWYFDRRIRSERIKSKIKLINRRQKVYRSVRIADIKRGVRVNKTYEELPHYLSRKDFKYKSELF